MIGLVRNKRYFYLCKKNIDDVKFGKPIKKFLNFQPTNSVGDMLSLGEEYSMHLKIKCTPKEAKDFHDKDRCYIYTKPSKPYNTLCDDADYEVNGNPLITLNEAEINLIKLSGEQY